MTINIYDTHMTREGYLGVSLPDSIVKAVDTIVEGKKEGYTSRAEFVKQAIREKLKRMEGN
jgi:metal-responsive CopG/Arc/MetJ family transcriptional regulator